ncbi:S-layer homology domain-containing protein [Aneurinibacillus soli]|nr:S-layer homology domain-containing protein [Aneurinibacillus soli]
MNLSILFPSSRVVAADEEGFKKILPTTEQYFFSFPQGVAVDNAGNMYVVDRDNRRIQKFKSDGTFETSWGGEYGAGAGQFKAPCGIAVDQHRNVYVSDTVNRNIQKFTPNANNPSEGQWEVFWSRDSDILTGIAVDQDGNVYVADLGYSSIKKFTPKDSGSGKWEDLEGTEFDSPTGIAVDRDGNVYVADTNNNRIQKFTPNDSGSGKWEVFVNGDLNNPNGIAVDEAGNVYVADTNNNRIQKFTSDGKVEKAWGKGGTNPGEFRYPCGIAVDKDGNMYAADTGNHRIQRLLVPKLLSSNANLKRVGISPGTLTPSSTTPDTFSATVSNDVSSISVTAEVEDSKATVKIKGTVSTSDTLTLDVGLDVGSNNIPVVVTAEDGTKKEYTITVNRGTGTVPVSGVALYQSTLSLTAGGSTAKLTATVKPDNATNKKVTWSSSNTDVATVDANGEVTPKTAGTTTITVTTEDGSEKATCLVTVQSASSGGSSGGGGGGGSRDTSSSTNTRTSSVLVGENEKGKQAASVEITRTVTADGKKSDTVTLDAKKAAEAMAKATDNMNKVTISIPDLKGNEAQEIVANVQKEALSTMADKGFSAQVVTDKATIELPKETVSSLSKKDVYMKIEPVTKENEIQQTKTLLGVQAKDGSVIGTPLHIETNFSGRTKITLPLTGMNIPTDAKKQEDFLQSLAIFIEHSDGEKKVDKGEIQYDEKHNPIGLSVWVDKFSTFTLVNLPKKKDDPKPQVPVFADIQGHWAQSHIQQLVQSGAVSGYPDGTFKPNQTITRAEFVSMVVKAFGLQAKEKQGYAFTDTQNHWAKAAIETAYTNGIINGYNTTTFGVNDTITREQMAVILTNIKKNGTEGKQLSFKDTASISTWAQKAVSQAVEEGIITGYPNQTFQPKKVATRAEAVTMIVNALAIK